MKIENPTEHLGDILALIENVFCDGDACRKACHLMRQLDEHLRSGGALPEQWRGSGTAVGYLIVDAEQNAGILAANGHDWSAGATTQCIAKVVGA